MDCRHARVLKIGIILPVMWLCMGAAEFPPFHMDQFDKDTQGDTFSEEVPSTLEVPQVSKRVYGAEEARRLPVKDVVIEGVVPYPEHGITQKKLQAIIEKRLRTEKDISLDDNGFTKRDLNDIGRFLREMIDRKGWDKDDLDNLVKMINRQQFERGWITIEQLDSIAQSVTDYYREHGFILATAFVPEQEVSDGVIHLKVLEGRLGSVTVSNNQIFSPETVSAAFNHELGQPVTEERIESALRRINDLPGVRVRGSFSPGKNVGETSLNLGVLDEQSWSSSLLLDNHGSPTTGEVRLFATLELLNLRNKGHRLQIGALRSQGSGSTYGLIEYGMPVTDDDRGRVKGTLSTNQFSVTTQLGTAARSVVGQTDNFGVSGTYQFVRSRTFNLSGEASFTQRNVLFTVQDVANLSTDQKIQVGNLGIDYNQLWDAPQLLFSGHLGVDQGHILSGAEQDQSTDFTNVLFTGNLLKRFSIHNWLTKNESYYNFVIKLNGQYTDKYLSSVEQFSLGGPNAVRAFSVSDVSVDSGAYTGFELFFDSPVNFSKKISWLDPVRPYVFFDYGYGVIRSASGDINQDVVLKAYGFGLRLSFANRGTANLIFAKPKTARFDDNASDVTGKSRVFFDIRYQIK